MTDDPQEPIKQLARKCSRANLNLRSSLALFDALYIADALALSGGVILTAAERAGVNQTTIIRSQKRAAKGGRDDDPRRGRTNTGRGDQ